MECKCIEGALSLARYLELIDTLWNVNQAHPHCICRDWQQN